MEDTITSLAEKGILGLMLAATCGFIYFLTRMHRETQKEERTAFASALKEQKAEDKSERAEDRKIFRETLADTADRFSDALAASTEVSKRVSEKIEQVEKALAVVCRAAGDCGNFKAK